MKIKDIIKEYTEQYTQMKIIVDECKYEFTDERIEKIMKFVEYINSDVEKTCDKKTTSNAGRPPDLKKYIEKNHVKNSTFNLDKYFEKFPNHKNKIQKQISDMVDEKKLMQLSNEEFKVIK